MYEMSFSNIAIFCSAKICEKLCLRESARKFVCENLRDFFLQELFTFVGRMLFAGCWEFGCGSSFGRHYKVYSIVGQRSGSFVEPASLSMTITIIFFG